MPYAPEHKVETRTRILDSARKLFNRNGLTTISIDEIMAGAGLTRGGFYQYFQSKEELYAEAITHFRDCEPAPWQREAFAANPQGQALAKAILDAYLSRTHLDDVDGSCPIIGLATDVARENGAAKRAYHQIMEMMTGVFGANLGPNPIAGIDRSVNDAETQRALAVVALCVGGMVLARAVGEEGPGDELRVAAHRYATALAGWDNKQAQHA